MISIINQSRTEYFTEYKEVKIEDDKIVLKQGNKNIVIAKYNSPREAAENYEDFLSAILYEKAIYRFNATKADNIKLKMAMLKKMKEDLL